jgi:uncharacterized membrane protein (Fun14 family)
VIIGEYSPRRSRGEYSPIITEPEANNCFSIFVFFGTEFILISLISLSCAVYNVHKTASRHFENFGLNTSDLTNQLVGFVMFTCAKILILYIHVYILQLLYFSGVVSLTKQQLLCENVRSIVCHSDTTIFHN